MTRGPSVLRRLVPLRASQCAENKNKLPLTRFALLSRRLDHLGPRDDVYVAVRPLLLEVHEPVRLEH